MISPAELTEYIAQLRAAGVTGPVKIGDIEVTIAAPVEKSDAPPAPKRDKKKDYDMLLFAATEGFPDEDEEKAS